jgi:prolyl 4-hydroxylase
VLNAEGMDRQALDQQPLFARALDILRGGTMAGLRQGLEALRAAIAAGEPDASCLLAVLTAEGIGGPQSWPGAFDLLLDAATGGSAAARRQLRILARTGDDKPDALREGDDPDLWRRYRRSIRLEDWLGPSENRVLCGAPPIVAVRAFLPQDACTWLIDRAAGRLKPALVFGSGADGPVKLGVRTNSAFQINLLDMDLVVLMVRARIAATIELPSRFLEPPQVLHYETAEQCAPHRDYLDPNIPGHAADFARRGQRVATFLIYLNSQFEGGETDFPALGLAHKGQAGDALFFGNVDPEGQPDVRTLHAGLAPTRGEKWLFSQWVRNRPAL